MAGVGQPHFAGFSGLFVPMEEQSPPEVAALPVATEVQFGMRAILVVMTVVSVAAAIVASIIRVLPADAQKQVAIYVAAVIAILIGSVFFVGWKRRLVEREAGPPLLVLTPHSYLFPRLPRLAAIASGVGLLSFSLLTIVATVAMIVEEGFRSVGHMYYVSFWAVGACASGIGYLWWNRSVRLCETGVLVRHRLVPWADCRRAYWDACYRDAMVLEWQQHVRIALRVPNDQRAAVETLLAEKVPNAKWTKVKEPAADSVTATAPPIA
jgi:hypothetical protein